MSNGASFQRLHLPSIALIFLSLFFLPLSTAIVAFHYACRPFSSADAARRRIRRSSFRPKRILITGIGLTKGLFLARTFYEAGHDVIGADFEPYGIRVNGRFSRSLREFYSLAKPNARDGLTHYLQHLLRIVQKEKIDLWINCSGVTSAVEDAQAKEVIERRSDCVAMQFDVRTTSILNKKLTFIQRTRELGLPVPETHNVLSRTAVHKILHSPGASKKKYIMKSVGADQRGNMTILPRRTMSETYNHVSAIPISSSSPWVLQEYIHGRKYCTHAMVIKNVVKAFVACQSSEHQIHYEALPPRSALSLAMQRFTQEFVSRNPPGTDLTGHLSFDFMVQEVVSEKGTQLVLRAIECHPRAQTAVVLFSGRSPELAEAYLHALHSHMNGHGEESSHLLEHHESSDTIEDEIPDQGIITPQAHPPKYHWIGHDIITLIFLPLLQRPKISSWLYIKNILTLLQRLLFWNDPTFVTWDPLPWWWLYQVYWPGIFLNSLLTGRKWNRVDISTGEVFEY
jgi:catechol O-methyltransferase